CRDERRQDVDREPRRPDPVKARMGKRCEIGASATRRKKPARCKLRLGIRRAMGSRTRRDGDFRGNRPMKDTAPKIEAMVRERYNQMPGDERVRIAASMFETARAIVLSSL